MKALKIIGFALGGLVLLILLAVGGLYAYTGSAVSKTVATAEHPFEAPRDSASVARGEHVVLALLKCADCHGANMAGTTMIADPAFGTLSAPNLTPGRGGVVAAMSDAELERAIRHGVRPDGTRLILMPSEEYQHVSDEDLKAVIAYIRALPPVDTAFAPAALGPIPRLLYVTADFPLFPYDIITHTDQVVASVPVDTTVEYGRYIGSVGCGGCHGAGYGGGKIPGTPPDFPSPANITPTGIGHYTYDGFVRAMREGVRPDGSAINPFMPIQATKLMTDTEIKAVWNYLRSLPPKEYGTR